MPRDWLIVGADGGIGSALAKRLPDALRTSRRAVSGWNRLPAGSGGPGVLAGATLGATSLRSPHTPEGEPARTPVPPTEAPARTPVPPLQSDTALSLDLKADPASWQLPESVEVAFLCAAVPSIDACRTKPVETRFINVEQTLRLAEMLAARGAFVVFLSTNQVFDGSVPFRDANDTPCPLTEYGRQKADAEKQILALGGAVVRFTKVFAGTPPLFRTWADMLRTGTPIEPFADMMFSPVPMSAAVDALVKVGSSRAAGIVQVSGEIDISYTDVALKLAADPSLVRPVSVSSRGIAHEAAPRFTTLETSRLAELGVRIPPVWETVEGLLLNATCHLCRTGTLKTIPAFAKLARVTSDAKPFPAGGTIAVCERCGTVQKPITPEWEAEADAIYSAYTIYHNAAGAEQNLFTGGGGQPKSRSSRLIQQVRDRVGLPASGRMMDLGCGNGAMLRSFGELMPGWSLVGNELSDKYRAEIEAIPHVEKLHAGQPEEVPGSFDALTLLHVLEHVPDPVSYLKRIATKLNAGGFVIVQVPDYRHSAFDLAVADHCTHFSVDTLRAAFEAAGLDVVAAADDFVPKELTIVGRLGGTVKELGSSAIPAAVTIDAVERRIAWLADLAHRGRELAGLNGSIGVFGTSIGGAWLLGELGSLVAFFVDEDPAKIGKTWDGRPIVCPVSAPDDVPVLIGLPHPIAANLKARLDELKTGTQLHMPRAA